MAGDGVDRMVLHPTLWQGRLSVCVQLYVDLPHNCCNHRTALVAVDQVIFFSLQSDAR